VKKEQKIISAGGRKCVYGFVNLGCLYLAVVRRIGKRQNIEERKEPRK